jgi:hypothetical protein
MSLKYVFLGVYSIKTAPEEINLSLYIELKNPISPVF